MPRRFQTHWIPDLEIDNTPTLERLRQGPVEHAVETVTYDRDERPVRSLADRAIGVLERMARRGAISDEMVAAAERFRADFTIGHLEPLRASQMRERVSGASQVPEASYRSLRARQRVVEAIAAVGQPGASCLWAVIGEEKPLKAWALGARVYDEHASGVLIAALGTLRAHYKL